MIGPLLVELALYAVVAVAGWLGARATIAGTLAAAGFRGDVGDAGAVRLAGDHAALWFVGGVVLVAVVRAATAFRQGRHIRTPLLLPAVLGAVALGLCVQLGYGNPFRADWPGPPFAHGAFLGCAVAAAVLALPGDLSALLSRARWALAGGAALLFLALAAFGDAPGASDQRVNLGPVQPIEAVKVATVLFLADYLGRRASKLRFQRARAGFLRVPRPRLLLPALGVLVATFAGLFLVKDLGPTLILGLVFLGLFTLVTRSPGWALLALGTVAGLLLFFAAFPELSFSSTVETRLRMWVDPWYNGLPHGDQIAAARWALAAGGLWGGGLGTGFPGALPTGHTDLVYAHLVEEMGVLGGTVWLLLVGVAVADGLRVAARARTPERSLMAAGLALLIVAQAAVIVGGTLGIVPLTGVVVPWLSFGKSSMAAFLGVAALIARLGEDGEVRADTDELRELRAGVVGLQVAVVAMALLAVGATSLLAVWKRDATSLRGVVTTLGDGTPVLLHDRRLASIAAEVRRGSILDREGRVLAESLTPDLRRYPLGDALGTVLGPPDGGLLRARWSVERQLDEKLRGWPDLPDGPAMWLGRFPDGERLLFAVPSAADEAPGERARAVRRHRQRGGEGDAVRRVPLAAPDLSTLLPLARLPLSERGPAVLKLSADTPSRSVSLTLDARLQEAAAAAAKDAAARGKVGAAAVVVLDADTGEVVARAQWPDYDPGGDAWRAKRLAADPKFMGVYGAWSDKTGAHGVWQAGSTFKLLTATVAVREGLVVLEGDAACPAGADPSFRCDDVHAGRTSFTLPGWGEPIHDFGDGGARGEVDLVEGIARSSNVYFGQLALKLGPEAFRKALEAGVEFGNPGLAAETDGPWTGLGAPESRRLAQTGFGQGAGSWSVSQAARVAGAVASGGVYRRCPPDLALGAACVATPLLGEGQSLVPVLSGMLGVMERGTGAGLRKLVPAGVRVYGKTGTADARGTRDERPWGIRPAQATTPHSWFVAIAEPAANPSCAADAPGRYVVAAVVPHGGFGASAAGPLALATVRAMADQGWFGGPQATARP